MDCLNDPKYIPLQNYARALSMKQPASRKCRSNTTTAPPAAATSLYCFTSLVNLSNRINCRRCMSHIASHHVYILLWVHPTNIYKKNIFSVHLCWRFDHRFRLFRLILVVLHVFMTCHEKWHEEKENTRKNTTFKQHFNNVSLFFLHRCVCNLCIWDSKLCP